MKRVRLVGLLAIGGLLVAACGSDSSSDGDDSAAESSSAAAQDHDNAATEYETADVSIVAVQGSTNALPTLVATNRGFFEEQGLDVELVNLAGPAITSALTSGSIQMTPQTVATAVQLKQRGVDARMIAGAFGAIPYAVVVPADSEIPAVEGDNWEDTIVALRGKTIGTSGPGSPLDYVMRSTFVAAGLSDDDFSTVQVRAGAPTLAAVQQSQVDAVVADLGTARSAEAAGAKIVMSFLSDGPEELANQVWSGFITTDEYIDQIEDLDKRLFDAMVATAEWMQDPANLDELYRMAVEESGVPESPTLEDTLVEMAENFQPVLPASGVQAAIDFLLETGQIEEDPTVAPEDIFFSGALEE